MTTEKQRAIWPDRPIGAPPPVGPGGSIVVVRLPKDLTDWLLAQDPTDLTLSRVIPAVLERERHRGTEAAAETRE